MAPGRGVERRVLALDDPISVPVTFVYILFFGYFFAFEFYGYILTESPFLC